MRWNIISPLLSAGSRYSFSPQSISITRLPGPKAFTNLSTDSNPPPTNANPPPTAIDRYFGRFPSFPYKPALPATNQFLRLCKAQNFRVPHVGLTEKGKEERRLFDEAFAEEFTAKFGNMEEESSEEEEDGSKEGDEKEDHEKKHHEEGGEDPRREWKHLAKVIEVEPMPETITRFKKEMRTIWVNIYDVLQAEKTGASVRRFESLRKLARYSTRRNKVFPLAVAKQGSVRFLLKKISVAWGRE